MKSKFFNFVNPLLTQLDNGRFYTNSLGIIYLLLAIANLLIPVYLLYVVVFETYLESISFESILLEVLEFSLMFFISWVCFQIWWHRRLQLIAPPMEGNEFIITPIFAHFVQTFGEWLGIWIILTGFFSAFFGLFGVYFFTFGFNYLILSLFDRINIGPSFAFFIPVVGFFILFASRFLAEQFKVFAAIANNTKQLGTSTTPAPPL